MCEALPCAYLPGWEDLLDVVQVDPIPILQLPFSTPGAEKTKTVRGWHLPGSRPAWQTGRAGSMGRHLVLPSLQARLTSLLARRKCPGDRTLCLHVLCGQVTL